MVEFPPPLAQDASNEQAAAWLEQIATAYQQSQALLAANRLGLFAALGEHCLSLRALQEALGVSERGLRILCDALAALGVLIKEAEGYRNGPAALACLTEDAPMSKTAIFRHHADLYERWATLPDAMRQGHKTEPPAPPDDNHAEGFAEAMADVARQSAVQTAEALDLDGAKTLLDLGGGPGLYAIELARRNPGLHAVVFDSAETLKVTERKIAEAQLDGRVTTHAGDALHDPLPGCFDAILLSNFVHIFDRATNQDVVKKCARALTPGGRVIIKDFALDESRTAPRWSALFAINMLVGTEGGDCYSESEIKAWGEAAGLQLTQSLAVGSHSSLWVLANSDARSRP